MKRSKLIYQRTVFLLNDLWHSCVKFFSPSCTSSEVADREQPTAYPLSLHSRDRSVANSPLPDILSSRLESYLCHQYQFRYNLLSELPEYCKGNSPFVQINQRVLNTLCLEAQESGIPCWDKDVARFLHSYRISNFHPFLHYMEALPTWDGVDRILPLAQRISHEAHWVDGFRRWLLGMAGQWMGRKERCANAVAPMLISHKQGWGKSTFCRLLVPNCLQAYYTDSFELTGQAGCEQKLAYFGLINLDEFDRLSEKRLPLLKNLMQMHTVNFRKAHRSSYSHMPRIASFIGTSNQRELLVDSTGSRRYLCMELNSPIDATPLEHKQLFAQLKSLLLAGERSWLSSEEEEVWQQHNSSYYRSFSLESLFFRLFRLAEVDEECCNFSVKEIFELLSRYYPMGMRGVKVLSLSRLLTKWGVERVHTKVGNLYRVVLVEESEGAKSL
ncbi:MAG: VapE domain-containing protein [Phocaeicola sp.]